MDSQTHSPLQGCSTSREREVSVLMCSPLRDRCADCQARGPTWASVNLGVFVCLNCSGVHRSLGVDISKVRSTTLDTWLPEQVAFVQSMGNRRANLFWEGRLPGHFRRPAEGDMSSLRHFISDKYRQVQSSIAELIEAGKDLRIISLRFGRQLRRPSLVSCMTIAAPKMSYSLLST